MVVFWSMKVTTKKAPLSFDFVLYLSQKVLLKTEIKVLEKSLGFSLTLYFLTKLIYKETLMVNENVNANLKMKLKDKISDFSKFISKCTCIQ